MPDLVIRIKKKTDGSAALSCTRADGSVTWQRQEGPLGRFFPLHDLTHYAVESTLGLRRAFYGLLAEGWDISDFGKPETRGRIPEEAGFAELVVGFLDLERMTGERPTAEDCNQRIRMQYENNKATPPSLSVTDEQLAQIRATRAAVFEQWNALAPGDAMEVSFDLRSSSRA